MLLLSFCAVLFAQRAVAFIHPSSPPAAGPPRATVESGEEVAATLLASASDDGKLASVVEAKLDSIDQTVLRRLMDASNEEATRTAAQRTMDALRTAADKRLVAARELLEAVLDAGELLEMDRRLVTLFKDGLADASFLTILNMNAVAARERATDEASEQRARVMEHLYTRAQEEWEKRCDNQANAVLHRLTRTEQPAIRRNILEYYLAPQTEILVPNADPVPLDPPRPPRLSSRDFATAVATAVAKLRQLDADADLIRTSVEECRIVAKEARLVVMERLTPEDLRAFEHDLMATFAPPEEEAA